MNKLKELFYAIRAFLNKGPVILEMKAEERTPEQSKTMAAWFGVVVAAWFVMVVFTIIASLYLSAIAVASVGMSGTAAYFAYIVLSMILARIIITLIMRAVFAVFFSHEGRADAYNEVHSGIYRAA